MEGENVPSGNEGGAPAPQQMPQPFEGTPKSGEPPSSIKLIATLYMIGGIIWLIYPFFYSWFLAGYLKDYYGYIPWASWMFNTVCCFIGAVIIAGLYFGIAGGLIKGMRGVWVWAVIFAIIALFNVPVGTIVGLLILVLLFTKKDVKEWLS